MLQKIPAFEQAHIALSVEALNTSKPKAFYQGGKLYDPSLQRQATDFSGGHPKL
jgi:hypothetical protein